MQLSYVISALHPIDNKGLQQEVLLNIWHHKFQQRKPYNYKVDIWALGVLYYQLIQGRAAFQGSTIDDVQKRLFKPLQFSKRFRQQQINVINMILKINPEQRPQIKQIIKSPYLNSNNFVCEVSRRSTTNELTFQQSKIRLISQKNMNDYQQKKILGGIHIMSVKNLTQLQQTNQLSRLIIKYSHHKIDKFDRTNLFLCPKQRILEENNQKILNTLFMILKQLFVNSKKLTYQLII